MTVNSTTERIVDSLHPHYSYHCTVAAVTIAGGPFSSNITITTAQDGINHYFYTTPNNIIIYYTHTAPSSAPVGLTVTSQSSSSLSLAWMAPPLERQNGLITGYSINVTNTDTGASMLLSSTGNSITVGELSPYTSYLCSVAAQTSAGQGPYTSPIIVTTDEDGKNEVLIVRHCS